MNDNWSRQELEASVVAYKERWITSSLSFTRTSTKHLMENQTTVQIHSVTVE